MEHSKAIDSLAAERYTLGELDEDERDAFEAHFFDCPECSMSVRDLAKVAATVRLGEPHGAALPRSRMNWWAAACVVLAGGLAYEPVVQRIAERPKPPIGIVQVLAPQLIKGESRGGEVATVFASPGEPVRIDVPFDEVTVRGPYRGEIRDARGRQVADTFDVPPPSLDPLSLFVGPGVLTSGTYTLVIRGAGAQEVSTYRFKVRFR